MLSGITEVTLLSGITDTIAVRYYRYYYCQVLQILLLSGITGTIIVKYYRYYCCQVLQVPLLSSITDTIVVYTVFSRPGGCPLCIFRCHPLLRPWIWILKCSSEQVHITVFVEFAVCDWWRHCKALCDGKFRQIEGNGPKFRHIELSNNFIN